MNRFLICYFVVWIFFAGAAAKAENIAPDATAEASGNYLTYYAENVIDGIQTNMWCSASTTDSWLYLEFQENVYIDEIVVYMYGSIYNLQDFAIEYLKPNAVVDPTTLQYVDNDWYVKDTVNDFGTVGNTYTYTEVDRGKTRAVRIRVTKGMVGYGNARIMELEVHGEYESSRNNVARYATAEASGNYWVYTPDNVADGMVDNFISGSDRSMWCSESTTDSWIYLDFQENVYVDEIVIYMYGDIYNLQDFTIEYLKPNAVIDSTTLQYADSDWYVKDTITDFGTSGTVYSYTEADRGKTKAVRIKITEGMVGYGQARIRELEVHGEYESSRNNVARYATAEASGNYWVYTPDNVADGMVDNFILGSDRSMWRSESTTDSWLYLDLHDEVYIEKIIMYMYGGIYNLQDFTVEYLNTNAVVDSTTLQYTDNDWYVKDTVTNFGTAGMLYTYTEASRIKTRAVRIKITKGMVGYGQSRIRELEVYGEYVVDPSNIAKYATAVSNSNNWIYTADNVTDGMVDNYISGSDRSMWCSAAESTSWLYLDWKNPVSIEKVGIYMASSAGTDPIYDLESFEIQKLIDGADPDLDTSWESAGVSHVETIDGKSTYQAAAPFKTRALRLYITDSGYDDYSRVREIEVKGDILSSYEVMSNAGSNRATGYSFSNKIVTTGTGTSRKTHFGWLDENLNVKLSTYNYSTESWSTQTIGTATDNHGGPSLCLDKTGRMHIVYGAHNSEFKYRYASSPYTSWSTETNTGIIGTYPCLVPDNNDEDDLYMVHRGENGSHELEFSIRTKVLWFYVWSNIKTLVAINTTNYKAYDASMVMDDNGRLHLAYVIYLVDRSTRAYYMYSDDKGSTWKKSDGTTLSLPVTSTAGGEIVFEKESPTAVLRIGTLAVDSNNKPWFSTYDLESKTANLHYYNGANWVRYDILSALRRKESDAWPDCNWPVSITNNDEIWIQAVYHTGDIDDSSWGSAGNKVALIRVMAEDLKTNGINANFTINLMKDFDPATPDWLTSIERNMGQNEVTQPASMYSHVMWNAASGDVHAIIPEIHLPADSLPPCPNPMTFSVNPYVYSSTSVEMVASEAYDENGVEYYFNEITGNSGGTSSGWISSSSYIDTGLSASTTYKYRCRTRDKSNKQNETQWSSLISVTTP